MTNHPNRSVGLKTISEIVDEFYQELVAIGCERPAARLVLERFAARLQNEWVNRRTTMTTTSKARQQRRRAFSDDNTEGYNATQLAELNRRYEERLAAYDQDMRAEKSLRDFVAERVLAEFDSAISA